jgi:hypothetical protein
MKLAQAFHATELVACLELLKADDALLGLTISCRAIFLRGEIDRHASRSIARSSGP